MGQKTNPIGLRVGSYRKWASSWYSISKDTPYYGSSLNKQTYLSQGVIASRGGVYYSPREDFLENLLKRYSITKLSSSRRFLPVDFRFFKGISGHTYGFLLYTKLLSRRLSNNLMRNKFSSIFTVQKQGSPSFFHSFNTTQSIKTVFYLPTKNYFRCQTNFRLVAFTYKLVEASLYFSVDSCQQNPGIASFANKVYSYSADSIFSTKKPCLTADIFFNKRANQLVSVSNNPYFYKLNSQSLPAVAFFNLYGFWFVNSKFIEKGQGHIYFTKKHRYYYQQTLSSFFQNLSCNLPRCSTVLKFNKHFNSNFGVNTKNGGKLFSNSSSKLLSSSFTRRLARISFKSVSAVAVNSHIQSLSNAKKMNFRSKRKKRAFPVFSPISTMSVSTNIAFRFKKLPRRIMNAPENAIVSSVAPTFKKNSSRALYFKRYSTEIGDSSLNSNFFNQFKHLLSLTTNSRYSFYYINALSVARYAFDEEMRSSQNSSEKHNTAFLSKKSVPSNALVKLSQRFLSSLERERQSRFRYVAVFIKDMVRVAFFARYLKKAAFLVSFIAFALSKLPRNRKETKFIRFIRKLIKVFSSQRKEIIGLRIRFQGRVNRWRRTKHILGEKGSISFFSYSSRIDFGRAQAITRKGAQGIRIWICFQPYFFKTLRNSIFAYSTIYQI